ncbi:MAG: AIR synthase-related protein, partial [Faecalibacterium sp.]|nr:AIR synthase-related protein [Faecalibacterium sp.]
ISESQERMAVALAPEDVDNFIAIANEENLEATPVAKVTEEKRLNMVWNGVSIVNISREFLNSNGAEKHQNVHVEKATVWQPQWEGLTFSQKMKNMVGDLNVCSKKGLPSGSTPPSVPLPCSCPSAVPTSSPPRTPWWQSCLWTARPAPAPAWPGASTPT